MIGYTALAPSSLDVVRVAQGHVRPPRGPLGPTPQTRQRDKSGHRSRITRQPSTPTRRRETTTAQQLRSGPRGHIVRHSRIPGWAPLDVCGVAPVLPWVLPYGHPGMAARAPAGPRASSLHQSQQFMDTFPGEISALHQTAATLRRPSAGNIGFIPWDCGSCVVARPTGATGSQHPGQPAPQEEDDLAMNISEP